MKKEEQKKTAAGTRREEEEYLRETLSVVRDNVKNYGSEVARMQADIDEMLEHYHDNDAEVLTILNNTVTLHDHMKRALIRNEKALKKPYFGRIVFRDEELGKEESLYIGKGGISRDTTHWVVVDWRAPVANAYYESGLGKCSYPAPGGERRAIDLHMKRTYEIEDGKLLDFYDSEVVTNDELLTRYLARNKQAVLGEIIATIQKEQNDIIRRSPYHNLIVQGVAGSGKTTVAMHRISYILYNYQERFKPEDFYIVGSNRILLDYITGVLPDLDVYGVRQMTMEQLFVRLLYEDWDENRFRIRPTDKLDRNGSVRGKLSWFGDLQEFCRRLEWETIPRGSIYLDPQQFVEGLRDGRSGVYDERQKVPFDAGRLVLLMDGGAVESYIRQNPGISVQSKIDMLNERLQNKIKEEFLIRGVRYTESERKAILRAHRSRYGNQEWKISIYDLYKDFLREQQEKGYKIRIPDREFDVYDLAALAYLYRRVKETERISEAHHIVVDEAQDFGMMAYAVLHFCISECTYTVMGDVSQNIHFGYGQNDWEELKELLLAGDRDYFGVLKKSYRNTVEISDFATRILRHGSFFSYPVEPIIRHGEPVRVEREERREQLPARAARVCRKWQEKGYDTIAVICRTREEAAAAAKSMGEHIPVAESDLSKAVFEKGILVLPVEYTKGLEFDAVLVWDPDRQKYPCDDEHAKLLYVAATRALHELHVLHTGALTGLIADPVPERKKPAERTLKKRISIVRAESTPDGSEEKEKTVPARPRAEKPVLPRPRAGVGKPMAQRAMAERPAVGRPVAGKPAVERPVPSRSRIQTAGFGDMPSNEKLRPAGHAKIDLAIKWVIRQEDGLLLQSRYGVLRMAPVGSGIIRVSFAPDQNSLPDRHPAIVLGETGHGWKYKDSARMVELTTPELCLQADKVTGAIRYMNREGKLLLAERNRECRQIDNKPGVQPGARLYLDWQKGENLYGAGKEEQGGLRLRGGAHYISHAGGEDLPLLLSDRCYGILMATGCPVICCDIPVYGSWLYAEGEKQLDFYFIGGKNQAVILRAYACLIGKL